MKLRPLFYAALMIVFSLLLAACGGGDSVMDATPQPDGQASGPTPSPTAVPTTLVVCLGEAPNTLFPYGAPNQAARWILQTIYDGPVDQRGYAFQPVLFEALPDIAAGTAAIQTVQVQAGDTVLDNQGSVVTLELGTFIRPAGCASADCAVAFAGNPTEMDQMVALFSLRQGIAWADGAPLTVADSVFGFSLAADPATPGSKSRVARTFSYEAVDANTIRWTGIPGFIDPQYQQNFWLPAPSHLWAEIPATELLQNPISAARPLGYGAFMISESDAGSYILLRNPNYFRAAEGLPRLDRLVFKVIGQDPQTNLDMLRSGECDLLDPGAAAGVGVAEIMARMADGELFASWANQDGWTLLNFGIQPQSYDDGYNIWAGDRPDFFGDVRTRQAIALCLDRQAISAEITLGVAPVMDSYLPPDHALFNPEIAQYRLDLEEAGRLLDEAGWLLNAEDQRAASGIEGIQDGTLLSFEILYAEHPQNARVVEMVSAQLAECGIDAQPAASTVEELFATGEDAPIFGRNFEMAFFAWQAAELPPCHLFLSEAIPGPDEDQYPYKWGGWNAAGWQNEEFDAACWAARGSAPGMEVYSASHAQAQQILAEQLPVIPMFSYQAAVLARVDICGLQFDPTAGMFWNIEQITYGENCP